MNEVTVQELKAMRDNNEDHLLFDVREQHEFDEMEMGGTLIPLGEIPTRFNEIPKEGKVIIHCRSGARSANAIAWLQQAQGYTNLYNLKGGIMAWKSEIGE